MDYEYDYFFNCLKNSKDLLVKTPWNFSLSQPIKKAEKFKIMNLNYTCTIFHCFLYMFTQLYNFKSACAGQYLVMSQLLIKMPFSQTTTWERSG